MRCFTQLPSDHIHYGHQGAADIPSCETQRGKFLFSFLNYFTRQKHGHRGNWDTIVQDAFTVDFGQPKFESAFAKIWDCRLTGAACRWKGWRVRGVPWWELGGPLDFRIVQEKIALSQKIFLAEDSTRGRETENFQSFFWGWGKENDSSLSACLLGTWRRQHLCPSQPLLKSYFTFGWIYFSVKKKEKKKENAL